MNKLTNEQRKLIAVLKCDRGFCVVLIVPEAARASLFRSSEAWALALGFLRIHTPGAYTQEDRQGPVHLFRASVVGALSKAETEAPGDRCSLKAAGCLWLWSVQAGTCRVGPAAPSALAGRKLVS